MEQKIFTQKMVRSIESLSNARKANLTDRQLIGIADLQYKFKFLGEWLSYRESLEFGENADVPMYGENDYLPLYGDYWWWLFRCMVKGWDYISSRAKTENNRDIQSSPRATFLSVLEEEFYLASSKVSMSNSNLLSKAILKDWMSIVNSYLRKNDVDLSVYDDIENITHLEAILKDIGIHYWLLVCLRNHPRNQNPSSALYHPWREFLKVLKREKAWVSQKGSKRKFKTSPVFLQWVAGTPYLPDGSIPF